MTEFTGRQLPSDNENNTRRGAPAVTFEPAQPVIFARLNDEYYVKFESEIKPSDGRLPLRTVTDFSIVKRDQQQYAIINDYENLSGFQLIGSCGTLDLNLDDGQRLSTGYWEGVHENHEIAIPIIRMDFRKPDWFRDGTEEVLVVIGQHAAYVLQEPAYRYAKFWKNSCPGRYLGFQKSDMSQEPPTWASIPIWRKVQTLLAEDSRPVSKKRALSDSEHATPQAKQRAGKGKDTEASPSPERRTSTDTLTDAEGELDSSVPQPMPQNERAATQLSTVESLATPPISLNAVQFAARSL